MNTRKARNSGSTVSELVGSLFGLGLVLLFFWGIGWSFYRHGAGHGVAAVFLPPYAWYRGVAALSDEPKWKEKYDVRTEQIAILVIYSLNSDPDWQMSSRDYVQSIKKWLKQVPEPERHKIKDASREFGAAMTDFTQHYLLAMLDGDSQPHPENNPAIQARVARFSGVKGLSEEWRRLLQDTSTMTDLMGVLRRGDTPKNLRLLRLSSDDSTAADRTQIENRIRAVIQAMNTKVEQTVNDLFAQ